MGSKCNEKIKIGIYKLDKAVTPYINPFNQCQNSNLFNPFISIVTESNT